MSHTSYWNRATPRRPGQSAEFKNTTQAMCVGRGNDIHRRYVAVGKEREWLEGQHRLCRPEPLLRYRRREQHLGWQPRQRR